LYKTGTQLPPPEKGTAAPLFSAHVYCGHGRTSQLLLSSCVNDCRGREEHEALSLKAPKQWSTEREFSSVERWGVWELFRVSSLSGFWERNPSRTRKLSIFAHFLRVLVHLETILQHALADFMLFVFCIYLKVHHRAVNLGILGSV